MAVKKKKKILHREITHKTYTGIKKIGDKGPQSWLPREILNLDEYIYNSKMGYSCVNDEYIEAPSNQYLAPMIGG